MRLLCLSGLRFVRFLLPALAWAGSSFSFAGHNLLLADPLAGTPILDDHDSAIPIMWDDRALPVRWQVHAAGSPASALSATAVAQAVETAFAQWENVSTSRITFQFDGFTSQSDGNAGFDGVNLITFSDPDDLLPAGVLAFTPSFSLTEDTVLEATNPLGLPAGLYRRGTILDADIIFNPNTGFTLVGNSLDVRSIACHEIGHLIGLSHSPIPAAPGTASFERATMYPFVSFSQLTLEWDDISGVSYYYPNSGSGFYPGGAPPYSLGEITGRVEDGQGRGLSGAMLLALPTDDTTRPVFTISDWDGSYRLPGLSPGVYRVQLAPFSTTNNPQGLWNLRYNPLTFTALTYAYPREYYSQPESASDDPDAWTPVVVWAGATQSGINIVANLAEPLSDEYEPNDTPSTARPLDLDYGLYSVRALIDPFEDEDWFRLDVPRGTRLSLIVEAQAIASALDSHLFLYEDRGTHLTLVAQNDDDPLRQSFDSAIYLYVTSFEGPHLALVRSYQEEGQPTSRGIYRLNITAVVPTPTPTPTATHTPTATWTPTSTPTPTPTGTPTPTPDPYDLVEDARIDELDLLEFLRRYDAGDLSADFSGDGRLDGLDLLLFGRRWAP